MAGNGNDGGWCLVRSHQKSEILKSLEVKQTELAAEEERKKATALKLAADERAAKLAEDEKIESLNKTTDTKGAQTSHLLPHSLYSLRLIMVDRLI